MKRNNPYLLAAALLAVAFTGCKNDEYDNKSPFDNVVYLNVSENSDTQVTTFKKTLPDLPKTFSVVLSYPASQAAQRRRRSRSVAGRNLQCPAQYVVDDARCEIL